MKSLIFTFVLFGLFSALSVQAQNSPATGENQESSRQLPEIELQDYTIVGLAKVNLPKKIRPQIFKSVNIGWINNPQLSDKQSTDFSFNFSRIKPSLYRLYDFPVFNSEVYYGSYNEIGVKLNAQLRAEGFMPYISADYLQTDGHIDFAQKKEAKVSGGFHQQIAENHLWHSEINYSYSDRGIYSQPVFAGGNLETETRLGEVFATLEQKWSNHFNTNLDGRFYLDEHLNAFNYDERGFDFSGKSVLGFSNTKLIIRGALNSRTIKHEEGLLNSSTVGYQPPGDKDYRLYSGQISASRKFGTLNLEAGALFQKEREETESTSQIRGQTTIYPQAKIGLGINGKGTFQISYQPGINLQNMRSLLPLFPFADFQNSGFRKTKNKVQGTFIYQLSNNLNMNLSGSVSTVENYLAVTNHSEIFLSNNTFTPYPGYMIDLIDKINLQKVRLKFYWQPAGSLQLNSWVQYEKSEIKAGPKTGMAVPYLPEISSSTTLSWRFIKANEISISAHQVGKRYFDMDNTISSNSFLLLSARLELALSKHFRIFAEGRNLLNEKYEEWLGFSAPGIHGIAGFRLVR